MNDFFALIGQFGFPIFMCIWFMGRTEKIIQANTKALAKISTLIKKCNKP